MKVIRDHFGYLVLDGDALKGAEEAFSERRYIEAFALLHALVDWWMIDLYQLNEDPSSSIGIGQALKGKVSMLEREDYRFKKSMKYLLDKGIVKPKEYERLQAFNKLRDRIIHRLVMYSYQRLEKNRIDEADAKAGFKEGKDLVILLRSKTEAAMRKLTNTPSEAPQ